LFFFLVLVFFDLLFTQVLQEIPCEVTRKVGVAALKG